jgi:DNA-binding transcriptional MerR regulator
MKHEDLTLEELSERTGVEPRTLRSWVSEGLLAPPFKQGRGARYPASNADRALAVRSLKDVHGLSLAEIGRRFMLATEEEIRDWARDAGLTGAPPGSAREYLRKLQGGGRDLAGRVPDAARREPPLASTSLDHAQGKPFAKWPQGRNPRLQAEDREADLASIERLILQLEKVLDAPVPRRSRGTIWTRISVTPDLELSVRGDLEPRERMLFEQLADQFRAILTRRTRND